MRRLPIVLCTLAVLLAGCAQDDDRPDERSDRTHELPADVLVDSKLGGCVDDVDGEVPAAFDKDAAVLAGPHYRLAVGWSARTDRIDTDDASLLDLRVAALVDAIVPAKGQEFLVVCVAGVTSLLPQYPTATSEPASDPKFAEVMGGVRLAAAGRRKAVAARATRSEGWMFVASVPKGKASLEVTDAGRTQSLDLDSGRRGSDADPAGYPVRTGEIDGHSTGRRLFTDPEPGRNLGSVKVSYGAAAISGYADGVGWARDGRAWLLVRTEIRGGTTNGAVFTLDRAGSFRLTPTGGIAVRAAPAKIRIGGRTLALLAFDIPAGTDVDGEITYDFVGTATVGARTFVPEPVTNDADDAPVRVRVG